MSSPEVIPNRNPALPGPRALFDRHVRPHLTPFNLSIAALIGLITALFGAITLILILVATNFNVLGWME